MKNFSHSYRLIPGDVIARVTLRHAFGCGDVTIDAEDLFSISGGPASLAERLLSRSNAVAATCA